MGGACLARDRGDEPEPLSLTGAAMHRPGLACCTVLLVLGFCGVHSRNVLLIVGECRRPWHGHQLLPPEVATRLFPATGPCWPQFLAEPPGARPFLVIPVWPSRFCPRQSGSALPHLKSELPGRPCGSRLLRLGGSAELESSQTSEKVPEKRIAPESPSFCRMTWSALLPPGPKVQYSIAHANSLSPS